MPDGPNISFAQFSIDCNATGFDFLKKTFNKQVRNFMIPSASWIDTTKDVKRALLYQQTLFDLSEIHARRFRKQLRENQRQFLKGTDIVKRINDQILTDLSKERLRYESDMMTDSGKQKQNNWTQKIQRELAELDMYAYEK